MGDTKKSSSFGSERRIWERILESLVTAMRSQQSQIKTLVHDREYLERYIEIMHDRWASKDELLRSRIAKVLLLWIPSLIVEIEKLIGLECDDFSRVIESLFLFFSWLIVE